MDAAISEGVPDFVLNARTDAFVLGKDRDPVDVLADAVERGKAYLEAGAPTVFVPGLLDEEQISTLVEAFGPQKLTVIGFPGSVALDRLAELGVARISYGPQPQRVALTALQKLVENIHRGGGVDPSTRQHLT
jgi:2-methylisocitrate lyase-like PEP mutase family enzyme